MQDLIRLLPDTVANQIAAGEVIQRPSSAVKELMENSLDAGATFIQLIIKDAGKTLVQVTDNGSGMSGTDARMSFERHATSKISSADDLFAIRSMGFRGEALASIASVAQVEMKTRRKEDEAGTVLEIEGSKVVRQEPTACPEGTTIMVKNLFFNVPARRNFLKSNAAETKHIIEEFHRLALSRSDLSFALHHDGFEVHRLHQGNLRQRITGLYGSSYNDRLVPVQEETTILKLSGFILKPEFARKTRGEQYFFVNNRFIKNPYLHHAVADAFDDLIPHGSFPSYFLFIEIDPAKIDVNIHPTKTEIKFEDDRSVYAIMRAAVKRSLGKFSITPSLDFDQEPGIQIPVSQYRETPKVPVIRVNPGFNPFMTDPAPTSDRPRATGWQKLYEGLSSEQVTGNPQELLPVETAESTCRVIGQLENRYLIAQMNGSLLLIERQAAHERIIYERNLALLSQAPAISQQELFPQTLEFPYDDFVMLCELAPDIRKLGFDLREFGNNTFVLNAVPAGIDPGTEKQLIDSILESYKNFQGGQRLPGQESLLRSVARNLAVKAGQPMENREMQKLADELMQCSEPSYSPSGKPVIITFSTQEIEKKFQQRS